MRLNRTDEIGSILWLLLAAAVFIVSGRLPAGTGETGPAFYPRIIALLIAVFALLQLGRSVYDDTTKAHVVHADQAKTVGIVSVFVIIYVLSLPWAGFVTATTLFLIVGMAYSGARSAVRIGGVAIGMSLLLYYLFAVLLRVPLPESPFVPVESLLPGLLHVGQGVVF
ncbi:MAG: tripartite tricarboxylate transporter TctB family protein [Halalkalicoccus sp.]